MNAHDQLARAESELNAYEHKLLELETKTRAGAQEQIAEPHTSETPKRCKFDPCHHAITLAVPGHFLHHTAATVPSLVMADGREIRCRATGTLSMREPQAGRLNRRVQKKTDVIHVVCPHQVVQFEC